MKRFRTTIDIMGKDEDAVVDFLRHVEKVSKEHWQFKMVVTGPLVEVEVFKAPMTRGINDAIHSTTL